MSQVALTGLPWDELRAYIWLRIAIYLVNSLIKNTDFRLIAAALKCAATVCKSECTLAIILDVVNYK